MTSLRASTASGIDDHGVLTDAALELLEDVEQSHGARRRQLIHARHVLAGQLRTGVRPGLLADTKDVRDDERWRVRPAPADLSDRRCEITGPSEAKMMISALNSGARVFMADIEDALSPSWPNVLAAQSNLRAYAHGELSFTRDDGRVDRVADDHATLVLRPRGLHLLEHHVQSDDGPVSASLFDVVMAAHHSSKALTERGSGLYLYLPKIESYLEARWWNEVLTNIENEVGLATGAIRVTVLIETILAAYQMEEILFELRDRICALNAGRWDYIFSVIKKFGTDASHVLPDRAQVTMRVPFMAAYAERLVALCHKRGAHAIGGMSAFIPNRRNPEVTERAIEQVRLDKEREAGLGYDGTWVAHPDLVPVATAVFDDRLGEEPNQLDVLPVVAPTTDALLDTAIASSAITANGLRLNVEVALRYLEAWLSGRGAVAIFDLMEDLATAEISRSQLWQWIFHGVTLDDGRTVTADLVSAEIDAIAARLIDEGHDESHIAAAVETLRFASLGTELAEFLSLVASPDDEAAAPQ